MWSLRGRKPARTTQSRGPVTAARIYGRLAPVEREPGLFLTATPIENGGRDSVGVGEKVMSIVVPAPRGSGWVSRVNFRGVELLNTGSDVQLPSAMWAAADSMAAYLGDPAQVSERSGRISEGLTRHLAHATGIHRAMMEGQSGVSSLPL